MSSVHVWLLLWNLFQKCQLAVGLCFTRLLLLVFTRSFHCCELVALEERQGFGFAVRSAMPLVKTPVVLVAQVGNPI